MLGIIGGMGPLASSLFYDMITEKTAARRDQDNLDLILLSHSSMPDRTAAILSGDPEQVADVREKLLVDATYLAKSGCTALAVTCNTAHYFIDMIEKEVPVPFIHLILETGAELARKCPGEKVAILATDGTIKTGLYQKEFARRGIEPYVPLASVQEKVMKEIYEHVKSGIPADREMWQEIETAVKEAGCGAAILACTELSVVRVQLKLDDFYLDPMEIMADRVIDFFRVSGEIR